MKVFLRHLRLWDTVTIEEKLVEKDPKHTTWVEKYLRDIMEIIFHHEEPQVESIMINIVKFGTT